MVTSAIERSLISNAVVFPARAGFWRRAVALVIDTFVIGLVFQVIAILAYAPSGGQVQSTGVLGAFSRGECQMLSTLPPDIKVPASFQANYAAECVISIFGYPMGHVIVVGRHTDQGGGIESDVSVTFSIDDQRHLLRCPPIDFLVLPVLILMRLFFDRARGGLGRRMVGIRLVRANEADERASDPAATSALLKRYGAFALLYAPLVVVFVYQQFFPGFTLVNEMLPLLLGVGALTLLLFIAVAVTIVRRKDTFYDRIAKTRVIQVPPGSA